MSAVILWWLMLEGLGLLALPLMFRLFGPAMAHGYPFAKIAALLLVSYVAWLLGFVLPVHLALGGALAGLLVLGIALALAQRAALGAWLRDGGSRQILYHAGLWAVGFLFFAFQRSMAPDIFGAEKYMDFAFLNMLVREDSMPPYDPWLSGADMNYYYFGYFMCANLMRLAPLPVTVSYNLCVATIGGLAFAQTAAVVFGITRRWGLAVLGGAMSALLGNLDGLLQFIEKGTLRGMDYWRSSRVVADGDTINEFPFFSTIHGDLHPHFIVLPVGILLLAILLDERLFPSRAEEQPTSPWRAFVPWAVATFVLAAMVAISNWELPMGVLVVALLAGRWQPLTPLFGRARLALGGRLLGMLVGVYVLFLPFYLAFDAPLVKPGPNEPCFGSACFTIARSSLAEFLTVFGLLLFPPALLLGVKAFELLAARQGEPRRAAQTTGDTARQASPSQVGGAAESAGGEGRHLLIAVAGLALVFAAFAGNAVLPLLALLLAVALVAAYRGSDGPERAGYLLIAAGVFALLACEVAFLKDSYGEKLYRMNTVFKLYFQAWTILAVASPWALGRLLGRSWSWAPMPRAITGAVALLVAASACYPLGITLDRIGAPVKTLDGNAYLAREHPDDYAGIEWLRQNVHDPVVILEATGNPYSYFARFASNTGLPTVLGWANHEGLWRGHDQAVLARRDDVARIYNAATIAEVEPLLQRYQVRYIIVGDLERENHSMGLQKFSDLAVAFRQGGTTIYRLN
jgi:YYY domain-containing protein